MKYSPPRFSPNFVSFVSSRENRLSGVDIKEDDPMLWFLSLESETTGKAGGLREQERLKAALALSRLKPGFSV
jgi:hypothetical protein